MKSSLSILIIFFVASISFSQTNAFYNVRTFGAKGDGKTLDTDAVNKTIDAASSKGGGTVFFPAGTYLCFSIRLKSNITIYIDNGATILAADPTKDVANFRKVKYVVRAGVVRTIDELSAMAQ